MGMVRCFKLCEVMFQATKKFVIARQLNMLINSPFLSVCDQKLTWFTSQKFDHMIIWFYHFCVIQSPVITPLHLLDKISLDEVRCLDESFLVRDEVPLKNAIQRMKVAREEIFIIVKVNLQLTSLIAFVPHINFGFGPSGFVLSTDLILRSRLEGRNRYQKKVDYILNWRNINAIENRYPTLKVLSHKIDGWSFCNLMPSFMSAH